MHSDIKIYKIKDFVRKNAAGEIDFDKSIQIVQELSAAAVFHAGHNILIDLRETTSSIAGIAEMMKIVMKFVQCIPSFTNKIANVIPNDANRVALARQFETCMQLKNFHYKVFTDFEQAIEWLSDVRQRGAKETG